jgi:hypothetical protein
MTFNETDLQNLLTLIDFHDDYDEVKEVWGFDIGPLREKIVTELTAPQYTSTLRFCQPPGFSNPHRSSQKLHQPLINTPKMLDIHSQVSYNNSITHSGAHLCQLHFNKRRRYVIE